MRVLVKILAGFFLTVFLQNSANVMHALVQKLASEDPSAKSDGWE